MKGMKRMKRVVSGMGLLLLAALLSSCAGMIFSEYPAGLLGIPFCGMVDLKVQIEPVIGNVFRWQHKLQ